MNKTISANVGGFVFNIEEGAYESLHSYLNAIRKSLSSDDDIDEIMHDIELRIAELFREILNREHKEVINPADVKEVIGIMGEPAAYGTDGQKGNENENESERGNKKQQSAPTDKQFFRDTENNMAGGVCSGISAYFGWDPLFLRVIFILLFIGFGTGLLLYIILWIIIPEAKTTTEKLRMRGEKVDVETIKQRFNDFKKDVEHLSTPEGKSKMRDASNRMADAMSGAAKNFYDIFGRLIGSLLIIGGIIFLVWLVKAMISSSFVFSIEESGINAFDFDQFGESFFGNSTRSTLVFLSVLGILLMPVLGMLLGGIRLIFRRRIKMKPIGAAMGIISTAAFITLTIIGIQTGVDFSKENSQESVLPIATKSDTLFLDVNKDLVFSDHFEDHHDSYFELIHFTEKTITYGYPLVDVIKSADTSFYIEVVREARGSNQSEAIDRAKNISYNYSVEDSLVRLDPVFVAPKGDLIRGQQIRVKLHVPIGKTIYLTPASDRVIYDIQNTTDTEDEKMVGKYWTMKTEGLTLMK